MSLQDEFRQDLPGEEELIAAGRRIAASGSSVGSPECPTKAQLMFFVAGRFNAARAWTIAEHLAECESCAATLAEIRAQQKISEGLIFRKRLLFATVAAVVLVTALVAAWLIRGRVSSETVTADLRDITRGVETSSDSQVVLHRNTRHLRVLLAPQAVEGHYEVALFNAMDRTSPLISRSASSSRENDSLVLEASVVVSNLQSGPYLLGIRHDNLEWAYYAIRID